MLPRKAPHDRARCQRVFVRRRAPDAQLQCYGLREHSTHFVAAVLITATVIFPARLCRATERGDIVVADFEGDNYGDWTVTGDAFGSGPVRGSLPGQQNVSGFELLARNHRGDLLREAKAYLGPMADLTGTLWEHNDPRASCCHAFAAHILASLHA